MKDKVLEALKNFFRPEFINRLDEVVVFDVLSKEIIEDITKNQIAELSKRLINKNVTLKVSDKAISRIAEMGYDPKYGARPIRRVIQTELLNPIALMLVSNIDKAGISVTVDIGKDDKLKIEQKRAVKSSIRTNLAKTKESDTM
jgi:ATP-dependent Clp protease ATP-binding subunit ClpB